MNLPVDLPKFEQRGLVFYELGGVGVFDFGNDGLAKANIINGELQMFPERSSMHKRVVGALNG